MPLYVKRIVGPAVSYPPKTFVEKAEKECVNILQADKRRDGRKACELRQSFLKVGVISQAKGSAYIEKGRTKVLCSVYGPREVSKKVGFNISGQIFCEFKYAPFSCPVRRQFLQDNEERELSQVLKQTLEPVICLHKFPKARVDVNILVIDNDGGALSESITAAGAALANAGIPMFDMVIGCSLLYVDNNFLIDPTTEEETIATSRQTSSQGTMTLGLMPSLQQVTCLLQNGVFEKHANIQGLNKLNDCCHQIKMVVEQALLKSWQEECSSSKNKCDDT